MNESMIVLFQKTIHFSEWNRMANQLCSCIGTTYIPCAHNLSEFVSAFMESNMNRCFNGSFSKAEQYLEIHDDKVDFMYTSTSGTEIQLWCENIKDENGAFSQIPNVEVKISLPSTRVDGGRCHYESITKAFLYDEFIERSENGKRIAKESSNLPFPVWAKEMLLNDNFTTPVGLIPSLKPVGGVIGELLQWYKCSKKDCYVCFNVQNNQFSSFVPDMGKLDRDFYSTFREPSCALSSWEYYPDDDDKDFEED